MSGAAPLAGRTALITGASRGLGAALARAFWDAGANLLLAARSADALDRVVDGLDERPGGLACTVGADVATDDGAQRILDAARSAFDRLDILVNNAAVQGPIGPAWENDWDAWRAAIETDLFGPVRLCRLAVPWMAERGGGSIVNLGGGGATGPRPGFTAYAAAKSALVRFSETLAGETRALGIRVNCVAPGVMPTGMLREVERAGPDRAGAKDYETARKALDARGGDPFARAAALCVFLGSDAAAGITGRLISAQWDRWEELPARAAELDRGDVYTLRRIVPKDRGLPWD